MSNGFKEIIDKKLLIREQEGASKVMPLREAIERHVKPGMALHFPLTHHLAQSAIYELARLFWGKNPLFTLVSITISRYGSVFIYGGMVKKVITTYFGETYPSPSPNPIVQKALMEGRVELENWSILSYTQRLWAGAQGLSFTTTHSILGSSMEKDNAESIRAVEGAFGSGEKVGLMRSMNPDISFIHALASDPYGNAIFTPPMGEGLWGCMASRGGTILTTERLVTTQFIRDHSHLPILPGHYVRSVSLTPMGAHPSGHYNPGIEGVDSYAEDYPFREDYVKACKNEETFDRWVKEWVLDCPTHEDYLNKLGYERLLFLKGKADADSWRYETEGLLPTLSQRRSYSSLEMMIVTASRILKEKVKNSGYRTMLAGVGGANLAAWITHYLLKEEGHFVDLIAEIGFFGYCPRPSDPFIFNLANAPTCKGLTDVITVMGVYAGGVNNSCIGAIGAGQIDQHGNVNSTLIPGKMYLVGSGGANDIISCAREILVAAPQSRGRFVEKVPYITGPGQRVRTLVSTLGVFEKRGEEETFVLTGIFPNSKELSHEESIRQVKEQCGWPLKVADEVKKVEPPSLDELLMLRLFDPERNFLGEEAGA